MKIKRLLVSTNREKYPILIGSKLILNLKKIIANESINFMKCLIIVDKNVPRKKINIIKKKLNKRETYLHFIEANEKNKNQWTTNKILEILLKRNFSREDILISVGGGITGDIAGYAASIFKRGLKFINIPLEFDFLSKAVDNCSFKRMKEKQDNNNNFNDLVIGSKNKSENSQKVREGKVSGYLEELSFDDIDFINNKMQKYDFIAKKFL